MIGKALLALAFALFLLDAFGVGPGHACGQTVPLLPLGLAAFVLAAFAD